MQVRMVEESVTNKRVTQNECMSFFSSISLTVGTSRLMETQMDLPRLLFGVGFQIFFL